MDEGRKPMIRFHWFCSRAICLIWIAGALGVPAGVRAADAEPVNPAPTAKAWADLAKLPDWSGVWTPDMIDQAKQVTGNPPPWTPQAAEQIARMEQEEKAGHPHLVFFGC